MTTVGSKALTPIRLLKIGFRLSLLAAVAMGIYSALAEATRVNAGKASAERIWSSMRCAANADNQALERVKHPMGNYDISRLGCGSGAGPNGAFIASAAEIERARRNDRSGVEFTFPFDPYVPLNEALGVLLMVNLIAGMLALAWVLGRWVIS